MIFKVYFFDLSLAMPTLKEAWPGNNRFCCKCCITGPSKDTPGIICVYVVQLAMLVPYSIIMLPINWMVSPVLPILYYVASILFNIFVILTACSDPGIIPRKPFLDRNP